MGPAPWEGRTSGLGVGGGAWEGLLGGGEDRAQPEPRQGSWGRRGGARGGGRAKRAFPRERERERTERGLSQPAPKYHTKGCSRSFVDSPVARTLVFAAFESFSSCEFRVSIARTPFCAILWRSPTQGSYRDRGGLLQENFFGEVFLGALQENPVVAPGQLHEKNCIELFW